MKPIFIVMRHDIRNNEDVVLTVHSQYENAAKATEIFNREFSAETAYRYAWICHRPCYDIE